ncbi:MAG: amidase [Acidimicrobiia bacterium]|nr:amidase [Acidimicrobiia bacterium]MBT8192509.1 amidase [Acidimicrobiia bacterium]MBT8247798.1 amidase [Acidimicrobiia bacterium]NNF87514.1 amidase [Acidimicrobiia bacterium]NNJ48526.1 amidase [Acidimicrobiia bacterium]
MTSFEPFADYESHDAVGLADFVARREVHPGELVEAAVHRIEARDPRINAVIRRGFEKARNQATAIPTGPFAGVPFLIKDLSFEAGEQVAFGSVFFRDYRADATSALVERFRSAGLISLGRTNTPELGLLPSTEPTIYGATANPWDLAASPGGSSGGAAAAVASGMVPMAHASDGGGSIRIPASACGLFGLKPTRGRTPQRPFSGPDGLPVGLCISRSVRDSATLLDAVHGAEGGDRWHAPSPAGSFAESARRHPERLRIAYTIHDFSGRRVHPDVAEAVLSTARLCEELGHEVIEDRPAIDRDQMAAAFLLLWEAVPASVFQLILEQANEQLAGRLIRKLGDWRAIRLIARLDGRKSGQPAFEPFTWALAKRAHSTRSGELAMAYGKLQAITYEVADFLDRVDLFLSPTLGTPPVRTGEIDQTIDLDDLIDQLVDYVEFTPLANFTGFPAMTVPLHWNEAGLPIGSHFLGRFGEEETLLGLAGQLETARPWWDKRPEL